MLHHLPPARFRLLAFGSVLCCALAAIAGAQNARAIAANSSNGRILEISFTPPGVTQLNTDANRRVGLQSILLRPDGSAGVQLLAADAAAGEVVFYASAAGAGLTVLGPSVTGNPRYPNGLSQDPAQNLYGVTSATGASSNAVPKLWVLLRSPGCPGASGGCLPGGYRGPVAYIDSLVDATTSIGGTPTRIEADLLEDTLVVDANAGLLVAGDVLVLCSSPAMLLRYPAAAVRGFLAELQAGGTPVEITPDVFVHPPQASVPLERRFPAGSEPNGMGFTPAGHLLISGGGGAVLHYLPDGTRLSGSSGFIDFATGLGQGKFKIATGQQDGRFRAFVSDRNGGEVLRFHLEPDGTGTLDAVVTGPQFPVGIATTTASAVPTPIGSNVLVATSDLLASTIESVSTAGSTGVREFVFEDPREREQSVGIDVPLHRSLFLDEISAQLPPGIEIPAFVRAQRRDDPLTGAPTFLLFLVDSTAGVFGLVSHVADEDALLGYRPDCDHPSTSLQPRLFWVPTPDEPQTPEGPVFINVSNDCGTSKGLTRNFSLFLASARDTRPLPEITDAQLSGLGQALERATCVPRQPHRAMRMRFDAALRQWRRGRIDRAIDELLAFEALVEGSPEAFADCQESEFGDLRARAGAVLFTLHRQL